VAIKTEILGRRPAAFSNGDDIEIMHAILEATRQESRNPAA
jgi:hypothetical protein